MNTADRAQALQSALNGRTMTTHITCCTDIALPAASQRASTDARKHRLLYKFVCQRSAMRNTCAVTPQCLSEFTQLSTSALAGAGGAGAKPTGEPG
jgi:hypothetical protein